MNREIKPVVDLLQPRYKVIADYPYNKRHRVGQIIAEPLESFYDKYPYIFRKLEWWEERTVEEMPKYVKYIGTKKVGKVFRWADNNSFVFVDYKDNREDVRGLLPATEQEYLNQVK